MHWIRRAKIVCTLGPATFSSEAIEKLILTGMDVARLNFSHGDYSIYDRVIRMIREKSHRLKKFIPIVQDLQGPKLRTGELENKELELKRGQRLLVTTQEIMGTEEMISVPFRPLPRLLKSGNSILIDDGLIELKVLRSKGHVIECRVVNGGVLKEHKGVNIPYVKTKEASLTLKDKKDLAFGIRKEVDFVALSFVRSAHDILELRKRIPKSKKIGIIAKIEKREAIDAFDEILEVSDGIMIARGDLAVESSTEIVPCLQKEIIQKCNRALKPVITATQMLESMVFHPRPTRAEASDVANAELDGSDALMLSSETASGHYPFETVSMMDKIIQEVEHHHFHLNQAYFAEPHIERRKRTSLAVHSDALERAACQLAEGVGAKLLCCLTERGRSAVELAHARPSQPIVALTNEPMTVRRLSLVWGVRSYLIKNLFKGKQIFKTIRAYLLQHKMVQVGDKIVITTGKFTHSPDTTHIVKAHQI